MQELYKLKNKSIPNLNTAILYTSDFNFGNDIEFFLKEKCSIITKNDSIKNPELNKELLNEFNCIDLKTKTNLTKIDKLKLNILEKLTNPTNCIVFFNILTYLDSEFKEKILMYLKNKKIIIINYTSEIEETLFSEYMLVVNNKEIIMEGPTKQILKEELILKKLGFKLPFVVELSSGLKYYSILNKIYYDKERLINELWK